MATLDIPWGPNGKAVYERTYSRKKDDGTFETWPETVTRVVTGNLALVYGDESTWSEEVWKEYHQLHAYMTTFKILPGGRQLWATGVPGRQFLFNCHVAGWGETLAEHFEFVFMRLVEGSGVGGNYSTDLFKHYGAPKRIMNVGVYIHPSHADYDKVEPYTHFIEEDNGYWYGVEDTREGWASALTFLINKSMEDTWTYDQIVFDVQAIRKEGSPLVSSGGVASGPAPLAKMLLDTVEVLNRAHKNEEFTPVDMMEIAHAVSVGAIAGGKRRAARMSMCHWNDPYIMDFIKSKEDGSKFWTTNISVEIDDKFIADLESGEETWAECVHEAVCEAVLKNGEPGYWNSSLSNVGESGRVIATNPCGEIPLEAWESCNLGSVNLDAFVDLDMPMGFDYHDLAEAHRLITRFMIRSTFGDMTNAKQTVVQNRNRRLGVSHMGVQGFFAKAYGLKYSDIPKSSEVNIHTAAGLLTRLKQEVRRAADEYAFELRIPAPIKITCEKPDGTGAKMPGVTEGIAAIYARWFEQRIRFCLTEPREFEQVQEFMAQGYKVEVDVYDPTGRTMVVVIPTENSLIGQMRDLGLDPDLIESQDQLTVEDMLAMQAFYQEFWADNGISYTVNIPEGTVTPEELAGILKEYLPRLKGTTIMVDASREQAPYTRISQEAYAVATAKRQSEAVDEACSTGACPVR